MIKKLRSRVLELFPYDLRVEIELLSRRRDIMNKEKQDELKKLLQKYHLQNVVPLGSGTNRYAFKINGFVVKVATDNDGKIDNMKEFKMAKILYPYVTKIYEISKNGTFLVAEYIQPFTSYGEMIQYSDKIKKILKELSSVYLIGDVGISPNNYSNWGLRVGYDDPVCLDFAYVYNVSSQLFMCRNCNQAVLIPNSDFTELVCPNQNCGKRYTFSEIRRRIGNDVHKQEIGDLTDIGYELSESGVETELDPMRSQYLEVPEGLTIEDNSQEENNEVEDDFVMDIYKLMRKENEEAEEIKVLTGTAIEDDEELKKDVHVIEGYMEVEPIEDESVFSGTIDDDELGKILDSVTSVHNPDVYDDEFFANALDDINNEYNVVKESGEVPIIDNIKHAVSALLEIDQNLGEIEFALRENDSREFKSYTEKIEEQSKRLKDECDKITVFFNSQNLSDDQILFFCHIDELDFASRKAYAINSHMHTMIDRITKVSKSETDGEKLAWYEYISQSIQKYIQSSEYDLIVNKIFGVTESVSQKEEEEEVPVIYGFSAPIDDSEDKPVAEEVISEETEDNKEEVKEEIRQTPGEKKVVRVKGYTISPHFHSHLYSNVSEMARRIAESLMKQGLQEKLEGHCNGKFTPEKFTRLIKSAIFKALAEYLKFTPEKVFDDRDNRWKTHFNPPENLQDPEFFDTMVFLDQYWKWADIRQYEGDDYVATMDIYRKRFPNTAVHGINRNWLNVLEASLKKNMFSIDQTGRNIITNMVDNDWCCDPTDTVLPEGMEVPVEEEEEVKVEKPKEEVAEVAPVEVVKEEVTEEATEDDPNEITADTIKEVIDFLAKNASEDEEEEEEDDDSELIPLQVQILKDKDYDCVKIVYSDEGGEVTIPLYVDIDNVVVPDTFAGNMWDWLAAICPDKLFITDYPQKWIEFNSMKLPHDNLRFVEITRDHDDYLMGMYIFAGAYRIEYDNPARELVDDELHTVMIKLSYLFNNPIMSLISHQETSIRNDEMLCDEDEVKEIASMFYPDFDITQHDNVNEESSNEITEEKFIDITEGDTSDNPYLAPVTEDEIDEFESRHKDIELPVFRKEIVQTEEMIQTEEQTEEDQ